MAYSSPRTWSSGEIVTAAMLNQDVRDNQLAAFPLGVDAWTAYTPTLTQSGAVTKTVDYAKYQRVGRWIVAQVFMTVTGSGTGGNAVLIGLPVAMAATIGLAIGTGEIFDSSATLVYKGHAIRQAASVVQLRPSNTTTAGVLGADTFTAALASNDHIALTVMYEAAS